MDAALAALHLCFLCRVGLGACRVLAPVLNAEDLVFARWRLAPPPHGAWCLDAEIQLQSRVCWAVLGS